MRLLKTIINSEWWAKITGFLVIFFIAFIPLYPKLPLLDVVGTWVYIRVEDFLMAICYLLLGVALITKRFRINSPLWFPILLYWIIGALSLVHALLFIFPTLSNVFPAVAVLHYLRRIEYMGLFVASFAVMYRFKKLRVIAIAVLVASVVGVVIYGFGQKFSGWPAYLTMNEEFAKGVPLRLPPTARITSTFGGHYDLAAYLVMVIPIIAALMFEVRNWIVKVSLFAVWFSSYVLLLFTASRVSFGVYLVAISFLLWWIKKRWLIPVVIVISIVMVNFVGSASERFMKTLRFDDVIVDLSTGKTIGTLESLSDGTAVIEKIAEPDEESLPKGSSFVNVPLGGDKTGTSSAVSSISVIRAKNLASGSGEVATISGSFLIEKAFVLDISITTRFQGQWPRAVAAFKRNIFLGSGYSTLNLAADGNYHRMLGETGILGTIAYLGILAYGFYIFFRYRNSLESIEFAFVTGLFAGIIGLLTNAILIDVFEASKVAFMLWLLLGVAMAMLHKGKLEVSYPTFLYRLFTHRIMIYIYPLLAVAIIYAPALAVYFTGDDFTWLKWADQSTLQSLLGNFTDAEGFFYRPIPKAWYAILFSLFWLLPTPYHIMSIGLFGVIVWSLISILRRLKVGVWSILLPVGWFITQSIHHENVIWVSGQSSLLAAVGLSLGLAITTPKNNSRGHWLPVLLSSGLVFLATLSYDSMIVAPIILSVWLYVLKVHRRWSWIPLGILPLYIGLRVYSSAAALEGDYGYNVSLLLVNSVVNSLSYLGSLFGGVPVLEMSSQLRDSLRIYKEWAIVGSVGSLILLGLFGIIFHSRFLKVARLVYKDRMLKLLGLTLIVFLTLVPFVGLGGVSERYGLFTSIAVLLWVSIFLSMLRHRVVYALIVVLLLSSSAWNYSDLQSRFREWQIAGRVSERALLSMRSNFFPLTEYRTFMFVNIPIRYGRAWIFPTGVSDAIWHIYREGPYVVYHFATPEEAFAIPRYHGEGRRILSFDEHYSLVELYAENTPIQ